MLLTSAYLAPVHYYTKLYHSALAQTPIIEEQAEHYVKQTYRNRCIIAADDGPIALTIPVSAPALAASKNPAPSISKTPTGEVVISDHGNWRHQHWHAIVSAYESSPYFEYYADDFKRIFHQPSERLVDFNASLRDYILDCLDLHPDITANTLHYIIPASDETASTADFRERIRPKTPFTDDPTFAPAPYWQVFASRHGFLPNMSIIDLLFNMGPESRIILRNSIRPAL